MGWGRAGLALVAPLECFDVVEEFGCCGEALDDDGVAEAGDDVLELGAGARVAGLASEHVVEEPDAVDDVVAASGGGGLAVVVEIEESEVVVDADAADEDVAAVDVAVVVALGVDLDEP